MRRWFAACGLALSLAAAAPAHAHDADMLWNIVHERCVPDQRLNNDPAPCTAVDLAEGEARGHVLLKDIKGPGQFLLIPTARITGIEAPRLSAADAPNYFAAAWAARFAVAAALHHTLRRDEVGLAVNSAEGRSQNQLHVHIDCLRADVAAALRRHAGELRESWSLFPAPLAGQRYLALRLDGATLAANPFRLLAARIGPAAMGRETIVVAGMNFAGRPGFALLAGHADRAAGDNGHGEELQDHSCGMED